MEVSKLLEYRAGIEKRLKELTGRSIPILQLSLSSQACGCVGLTVFPNGLKLEDVEVFKEYFLPYFKGVSMDMGVVPRNVYVQTGPDDATILKLKSQDSCERCRRWYQSRINPSPNIYIVNSEDIEIESTKRFSLQRSNFEDELRRSTGMAIYAREFGTFSLRCGCIGLVTSTIGLRMDDIKALEGRLHSYLNKMTVEFGIEPYVTYASVAHGSSEVTALTSKHPCERCRPMYDAPPASIYVIRE
jgi:hypothetical protein